MAGDQALVQDAALAAPHAASASAIAQVLDGITSFSFSDLATRQMAAQHTGPGAQRQALSCDLLSLYTVEAVTQAQHAGSTNGVRCLLSP